MFAKVNSEPKWIKGQTGDCRSWVLSLWYTPYGKTWNRSIIWSGFFFGKGVA